MKRTWMLLVLCLALVLTACGGAASVIGTHWNENGELILEMSDGTTQNAGKHEENPQGLAFHKLPDGTWGVTVGNASRLKEITVPATYRGSAVTAVLDKGFYGAKLTAITLPDSITEIGAQAFAYTALQGIELPAALESIGKEAFAWCKGLFSVVIPAGVTEIGENLFSGCYRLVEVGNLSAVTLRAGEDGELPESVQNVYTATAGGTQITEQDGCVFFEQEGDCRLIAYIGTQTALALPATHNGKPYELREYAFYGCDALTSVEFSAAVSSIPAYAFASCTRLERVVLPEGVTEIAAYAFSGCTALRELNIPRSVTAVFEESFYNCEALKRLEDNVFYVDGWAIDSQGYEKKLRPDTVGLGVYAFFVLDDTAELVLPDGLRVICERAVCNATRLLRVVLPASLEYVDEMALVQCQMLVGVYYKGGIENAALFDGLLLPEEVAVHYYSAEEPTVEGDFWYYDTEGNIQVW